MSADKIAAGLGISRSTVQRAIKAAQTDGVLRIESFRNHDGHKVSQRWVVIERFAAANRKTQASPDDAKAMCHTDTEPSVTDDKAKRQTEQTQVSSGDALLGKTLISNSLIMKNRLEDQRNSAQIEKITIAGRSFTRSEWDTTAKTYTSFGFGSGSARIEFADGSTDFVLIGWDAAQHRYVLRSRLGGAVIL